MCCVELVKQACIILHIRPSMFAWRASAPRQDVTLESSQQVTSDPTGNQIRSEGRIERRLRLGKQWIHLEM